MTLIRTGLGFTAQQRTGVGSTHGRRTYLGDTDGASTAVPLRWDLTALASNAVAAVVTNTNVTVCARNSDGTLGAAITGTWTSGTGTATDAGLTPTDDGSNFVGIASAPAAGKRCRFYFADTQDVEWVLPGHVLNPQTRTRQPLDRPFGLMVEGGRNHRMVGAHWGFSRDWLTDTTPTAQGQNTPTGTGYKAQWNRCLYLKDWTGVFDIVGMQMQPGNLYEAMNVTNYKPSPRLRIQRSRIDGVTWYDPGTASGHDGGDALQTWHGPTGTLEIDHLSIITDYQGLFLSPYDVGTDNVPAGQSINYTNIRTVRPSGAWVYYNVKGAATVPPTTLDHVFVTDVANPTRSMDGSTGSLVKTANVAPVVSSGGATADWTTVAGSGTTGSITRVADGTTLPGGAGPDYAPAARTGLNYDASWSGWTPSGS